MSEVKPFKRILVEIEDGEAIDIKNLPKDHYEHFLKLTNEIRLAYTAIQTKSNPTGAHHE